ncbi:hypothetical protein O1611_g1581 [Lasiodiplodia mahajangana]|uniref:Uncharacterized protein n=1 Tax=Lasiodiplodia mahajangana TaxID=1108764 RepID=A0ACC2JX88_9PEZI|nr:hypothetical protein O1611_g1581 [Lasiodiplodia mahajangana]
MPNPRWRQQIHDLELLLEDSPVEQFHYIVKVTKGAETGDAADNVSEAETSDRTDDESEADSISSRPMRVFGKLIPEVRYYNLAGYLGRISENKEDCIIAVLMTDTQNWKADIQAEIKRLRERVVVRDSPMTEMPPAIVSSDIGAFGKGYRMRRVRIQSKAVLQALSSFTPDGEFTGRSIVFPRPFVTFHHTYERMKARLAEMERMNVVSKDPGRQLLENPAPVSTDIYGDTPAGGEAYQTASVDTETQLQDMRCYIHFVETEILSLWSSIKPNTEPNPTFVEFEDLPCVLKEGDLMYVPQTTPQQSAHKRLWRLSGINRPDGGIVCWLHCLDYNGDEVEVIRRDVTTPYFFGQRDMRTLPCYPLSFHVDPAAVLKEAESIGSHFLFCIQKRPESILYSGWTLVSGIAGEALLDGEGDRITAAEYIESEIIVDFKEALRNCPEWGRISPRIRHREVRRVASPSPSPPPTTRTRIRIRSAQEDSSDAERRRVFRGPPTRVLMWDDTAILAKYLKFCEDTRVLKEQNQGIDIDQLTREEIILLPQRIFAYVLRERRFLRLDIQGVPRDLHRKRVTLDDIQMNKAHKKIIRSSVSSHLDAQLEEKESGEFDLDVDVIRGKGKSLVILLHGAPGVGKTATAEAIAIERNRPLFPISCADLGFSPKDVERTLRDIFRYAHLWECILLLDEADVFLTQRERGGDSLERNAIVGVFLRTLEYYSGILFLTTNRVGALDEAFRSRVHISLWYPYLSLNDTISILRSNLERLPRLDKSKNSTRGIKIKYEEIEDFIVREYEEYSRAVKKSRGPWNGRQIRNAVQVAACLALYEKKTSEDEDLPAILTAEHFRTVAETTREFENFLKIAKVGDDEFLARQRQERVDDFEDRGKRRDDTKKAEYSRYKSRSNLMPSQSTSNYGRSSRLDYSDDQYDPLDNEDVGLDQQAQERRHGKAAIPRRLNEEHDIIGGKTRHRHHSDTFDEDRVTQPEVEDDELPSAYRGRGGEGSSSTRRNREKEYKHDAVVTDRRRRRDDYDRYEG